MNSQSRNPLLLQQNDCETSSDDESNQEAAGTIYENHNRSESKESYTRSSSTPVDHYKFAYIVFYILGM